MLKNLQPLFSETLSKPHQTDPFVRKIFPADTLRRSNFSMEWLRYCPPHLPHLGDQSPHGFYDQH